jgi:hypothetical protein
MKKYIDYVQAMIEHNEVPIPYKNWLLTPAAKKDPVPNFTYNGELPVWDNLEIEGCITDGENVSVVYDEEPDFWSVYVHDVKGGVQCIADLPSQETAEDFKVLISKLLRSFKDNGYLALYSNESLQSKVNELIDGHLKNSYG